MGPLRLDSASVARKMSDVIRPLHNFAPFVRPFSGILSVIAMFRQLRNSSNVLTLRMDRYPLSELTGASFCVPRTLAGLFEQLGGGLLNLASQTLIGFGTF